MADDRKNGNGWVDGLKTAGAFVGPIIGALILWYVNGLDAKFNKIDEKFVALFNHFSDVDKTNAAAAEADRQRDSEIGDLVKTTRSHEARLSCIELSGHSCRPAAFPP